jgi:glutamate racemase
VSDTRAIGVFDSGLGGLTVVRELAHILPAERIMYLGDIARYPYGNRSDETIRMFGAQDARFLLGKDIKMLVVACNTVSSVALEHIREQVPEIPVIGVVLPGARAAVERTAERKVGVIGTHATIRTQSYTEAIRRMDGRISVHAKACPLFVPLVEEGMMDSDIARLTAQYYLYDIVDTGIDCLILGCTHYPLLMEAIQETVGTRVQLLDSAHWAAREAQDILARIEALAPAGGDGLAQSTFYVTDMTARFGEQAERFLGRAVPGVQKVPLDELAK